ncbi:MAG: hypothetical protein GY953_52745 [bacterium]|nr:hypothetical protein [bacterium]
MNVQHVNVKIFAQEPAAINLGDAIPVFHRWIQDKVGDELLIDVADYQQVPGGPGVMLVSHEAHYSLGSGDGRLGLLHNRRTAVEGTTQEKLRLSYDAALAAAKRLEEEPEFRGKLKFHPGDCEVIFNDRLLTPNNDETWAALEPELAAFFTGLWGAGSFTLEHVGEPRDRLRIQASVNAHALQPV